MRENKDFVGLGLTTNQKGWIAKRQESKEEGCKTMKRTREFIGREYHLGISTRRRGQMFPADEIKSRHCVGVWRGSDLGRAREESETSFRPDTLIS